MPQRLIHLAYDLTVTILSFFWFIAWLNAMAFVPILLSTLYWLPKIKYTVVNKYHNGSWVEWVVSFRYLFKNKKQINGESNKEQQGDI